MKTLMFEYAIVQVQKFYQLKKPWGKCGNTMHLIIVIKKQRGSLETRALLLKFSLELETSGGGFTEHTSRQQQVVTFMRNYLVKMTLRLLLWSWYQGVWGSSEDRYRSRVYCKCSSCVIICWIAKIYQSINNKLWKNFGS